jgi:hypothetical protein
MPIDALIIGLIVLLICCSASFYLYMRLTFAERKITMMESLVLDMKVVMDQLLTGANGGSGGGGASISHAAPPTEVESEPIPEDNFYSSVLEQAHEESLDEGAAQEGASLDKVMEGLSEAEPVVAPTAEEPKLDDMTKADLVALAEKRGLRVKKTSNREQLLTLLRRASPIQNSGVTAGTENVSGSLGTGFQDGASLDGSINVDLGQGGASLE